MAVYNECNASDVKNRNTGANEQCLEGLMVFPVLAVPGFKFESIADFKNKEKWVEAIAEKKLIPLFDVEELTPANTEDTYFEGRTKRYRTAVGKKMTTYTSFLSVCSHFALKSYDKKDMQLFEFTEDNAIKGVNAGSGAVKGQDVYLEIGKRVDATADRPASTQVTINYKDYNQFEDNAVIARPEWSYTDLYGIFDVTLQLISATSTNIVLKVLTGCGGGDMPVEGLLAADFVVRNATGQAQSVTLTESNGVYTIVGTDFATGYTVELKEVVTIDDISYEGEDSITLTVPTTGV